MTDLSRLLSALGLTTVQLSQLLSCGLPSVHRWRHGHAAPTGLAKLCMELLSDLIDRPGEDPARLGAALAALLRRRGCTAALQYILTLSLEEDDDNDNGSA